MGRLIHFGSILILALAGGFGESASFAQQTVIYTYDAVGRIATALYDNNTCIVYTYDANGNRTATVITSGGAPTTPTWGTGTWGCFKWQ